MVFQVFFAPPDLLEDEDVIFLYVLVDLGTETARLDAAPPRRRSEDFQCLITLFGRYDHPNGRLNHVVFLFVTLLTGHWCFLLGKKILGVLGENN